MHKLTFLFGLFTVIACTNHSEEIITFDLSSEFLGKWDLVKTTGQLANSEQSGEDIMYQEFYVFSEDNSFVKTRTEGNKITSVNGSYRISTLENSSNLEKHIEITHSSTNKLIVNCGTSPLTEYLIFSPNGELYNTAVACDRTGHYYQHLTKKN